MPPSASGNSSSSCGSGINHIKIFVLLSLVIAIANIHEIQYLSLTRNDALDNGHPHDVPRYFQRGDVTKHNATTTSNGNGSNGNRDCFKARNDTVPTSRYGKLLSNNSIAINLGFPKIGSTSIHSFFACAGYRAMHYRCTEDFPCAECITQSIREHEDEGGPHPDPFAKCGKADVYSQIDNGSWGNFPQIEYLEEIVRGVPDGSTFFLTFRSMEKWYHSMSDWPPENTPGNHMSDGLRVANIPGFPSGKGRNREEFSRWFCNHVERVRGVLAQNNPSHTLVEIDIEDPTISSRMADIFDIDERCWGHQNVNAKLHPELPQLRNPKNNQSEQQGPYPWFVRGKRCIRGKTEMRKKRMGPLPVLPGFPPWMFIDNTTCDDDGRRQELIGDGAD